MNKYEGKDEGKGRGTLPGRPVLIAGTTPEERSEAKRCRWCSIGSERVRVDICAKTQPREIPGVPDCAPVQTIRAHYRDSGGVHPETITPRDMAVFLTYLSYTLQAATF